MPRFRFALQPVLDHREMIEEQKQRAVAVLEAQRVRLEETIRDHQRGITPERQEMRASLRAGNLRAVRLQSGASVRLAAAAQRAVIELAGVHRRLEAARTELLDAAKRRKAVELLKERWYEDWRTDQNRR